jgi:predicted GNAT superfamily acetyltransferase
MPDTHALDDRSVPHPSARPVDADAASVTIRQITSIDEYRACVVLQQDIWGTEFDETVPGSILQIASEVGGLTVGAFAPDGTLVGFVFGLIGMHGAEIVHWSHMLGVREAARNSGIGGRLKDYQRAELARRGIARVYWTFDPLQARNAHLNLNRLGAHVIDYAVNRYGLTRSPLHYGLATDRLIVMCPTTDAPSRILPHADEHAPILSAFPRPGDLTFEANGAGPSIALIEIPADLEHVVARAPEAAATWRASTRLHFQWALRAGYTITGLSRHPDTTRAFYVIAKPARAGIP